MTIEQQKKIADDILERLSVIDPNCILAGGAPRDWYFGQEANDLDIYYYTHEMREGIGREILKRVFPEMCWPPSDDYMQSSQYKFLEDLIRIRNTSVDGLKVQLIQLNTPKSTFTVVDRMSCSICKVWRKGGKTRATRDFALTEGSKVMFLAEGYNWSDPHPKKMKERFSDYYASTKEQATESLVRKQIGNTLWNSID